MTKLWPRGIEVVKNPSQLIKNIDEYFSNSTCNVKLPEDVVAPSLEGRRFALETSDNHEPMLLTGPRMGYKVPGRNVGGGGPQCREKLFDSGFKTMLRSPCRARRLAWS